MRADRVPQTGHAAVVLTGASALSQSPLLEADRGPGVMPNHTTGGDVERVDPDLTKRRAVLATSSDQKP
jgi:hypothetical protein